MFFVEKNEVIQGGTKLHKIAIKSVKTQISYINLIKCNKGICKSYNHDSFFLSALLSASQFAEV